MGAGEPVQAPELAVKVWPTTALPEIAGVVAIPTQGFYDDAEAGRQLVRWAFCKERDVIGEGVRRLAEADLSR